MPGQISPAKAAAWIRSRFPRTPALGFVLGSGFHKASSFIQEETRLPYHAIPGFATPSVGGHEGHLVLGQATTLPVAILAGRSHYYEGHSMAQIAFPIRVLAELGIKTLVLTNAAGGIHPRLRPGHFMLIRDHINSMGVNPLRGTTPRFVDLTTLYSQRLRTSMLRVARRLRITVREGVYMAVSGPSYETPAEILAFKSMGADAVGMSTVPEAMVARQCGLEVVGLSLITNLAAGLSRDKLTHEDVLKTADDSAETAAELLREFSQDYAELR